MVKILLLEDDETISFGIQSALSKKGYEIICCDTITAAKKSFCEDIQLVLLDLNLPDGNGYTFCKWLKSQRDVRIIFLTVRDDVSDITKGLDMGADDYITKPFHIAVLESRIGAVLRRSPEKEENLLICGNIRLDKHKMQTAMHGNIIDLTALEYRLLLVLMENKGRTLPRSLIFEKLWDIDGNFVNDNTLTVTMKRLREKLGNPGNIVTIRGIGYRMEDIL